VVDRFTERNAALVEKFPNERERFRAGASPAAKTHIGHIRPMWPFRLARDLTPQPETCLDPFWLPQLGGTVRCGRRPVGENSPPRI